MSSSYKVLSGVLVTKVSTLCTLVITSIGKTFIVFASPCITAPPPPPPRQVNMADPVVYKTSLTVLNIFLMIASTVLLFSGLVLLSVYHMAKVNIALVTISSQAELFSWSFGPGIITPPLSVC